MLVEPGDRRVVIQRDLNAPAVIGWYILGRDPADTGRAVVQHQPRLIDAGSAGHRLERCVEDLADPQRRSRHRRYAVEQAELLYLPLCLSEEPDVLHTQRYLRADVDQEALVPPAESIDGAAAGDERPDRRAVVVVQRDADVRARMIALADEHRLEALRL